jgi:hypothetical protein
MAMTKASESSHTPSLQRFALEDLAPFTKEGMFSTSASRDFHLFYVGRDSVDVELVEALVQCGLVVLDIN